MLDQNMRYIEFGEEKFPLKCTLETLEKIQDEYGSVNQFEKDLFGREKEGEEWRFTEPKMKAVRLGLFLFVNKGLELEGREPLLKEELEEKVDKGPNEITAMLVQVYMDCFAGKKKEPQEKQEKQKSRKR